MTSPTAEDEPSATGSLSTDAQSPTYLPDHGPLLTGPGPSGLGELHLAALALAEDADLLIHDAHFTAAELGSFVHYGHSAIEYAVELTEYANV